MEAQRVEQAAEFIDRPPAVQAAPARDAGSSAPAVSAWHRVLLRIGWAGNGRLIGFVDGFLPPATHETAEGRRRAQLFIALSFLGVLFGLLFSGFYLLIGHFWGALIVLACTSAMTSAPWLVRKGDLEAAGNVYALVLVLGFTALTAIEGGLHGHAVAWLAVVPLCASILVGQKLGYVWCGVCLGVMAVFCALDFAGVKVPRLYAPRWEAAITAAGYLSLTVFMSALGIFFEYGRRRSLEKLHGALDALSQANVRLQHLNRERSAFLGMAAHDLRNPLALIVGFAQVARDYSVDPSAIQIESLNHILKASGRMKDLLDRLLSVEAIEEGKFEMEIEDCDLGPLVEAAVGNHQSAAVAKEIALRYTPPAQITRVRADAKAVGQIVDNLVSNAVKFSPRGRPVEVRVVLADAGRFARVEVQDAGPGLSEKDLSQLYGKFARLSARPTAGESSSGLGLSIVKRLSEAMGGQLDCRSKLGEGATFSLGLPVCAPAAGELSPGKG